MADMEILDTGYLTTTTTSGTTAPRANSGSAIALKSVDVTYEGSGNIDNTPIINANTNAVLNFGSIGNAKVTLAATMNSNDTTAMDLMGDLNDLRKTLGIKLLYYGSTTDGYRDITDSIGSTDAQHLSGTIPHLHVRVTNFTIRQTGEGRLLRYTLTMEETA